MKKTLIVATLLLTACAASEDVQLDRQIAEIELHEELLRREKECERQGGVAITRVRPSRIPRGRVLETGCQHRF